MNTIDIKHNTVKHLYLADILYGAISGKIKNRQHVRPQTQLLMNSVTQYAIDGYIPIVCWNMHMFRQKSTFERQSAFQSRGNNVLKGATNKGKNMLSKGSIFFP